MVDARAREDLVQRRHEIIRDRAAQAAVGQFDDILFRAALDAAAFQDLAIDAHIAEFIDDHGQLPPAGILQKVADERGLACPEEAGDDGTGHAGNAGHILSSQKERGGTRAIMPRLRLSGRPRQGIRPSVEPANRVAPVRRSGAEPG